MALILIGHPADHDPGNQGVELPVLAFWDGVTAVSVCPSSLKKGHVHVDDQGKAHLLTGPVEFVSEADMAAAASMMLSRKLGIDADANFLIKPNTQPIEYSGKLLTAEATVDL